MISTSDRRRRRRRRRRISQEGIFVASVNSTGDASGGIVVESGNATTAEVDETYEYVTVSIEFTVGNIQPSTGVGNMNDIRSKLSFVLRKALTDLSDADANLRFTSIEGGGIPPRLGVGGSLSGGGGGSTEGADEEDTHPPPSRRSLACITMSRYCESRTCGHCCSTSRVMRQRGVVRGEEGDGTGGCGLRRSGGDASEGRGMDDDAVVGPGRNIRWAAFGGVGSPASNDAILFLGVAA